MIAIINYGLGNLSSILNMHKRLGIEAVITADFEVLEKAQKLILPGVGHFKKGMENLKESGLQPFLNKQVLENKKPILGICLGAQLMTKHSEEGDVDGLGWVDADTILFQKHRLGNLRVPHMGWGDIKISIENPLLKNLPEDPSFYHVHSYHFNFTEPTEVIATTKYGYEFASAFQKENIFGTQFHPEKSHKSGMKVLENFAGEC